MSKENGDKKIEPLHVSQAYGIDPNTDLEFFDANLRYDSRLFIDPFLLKRSHIKEERDLFEKFGDFFKEAYKKSISTETDKVKSLSNFLSFKEPKEISLGFTKDSNHGRGLAGHFAAALIHFFLNDSAKRVVNEDHLYPDQKFNPAILPLLSEDLGPDGISDLAGNLFMDYLIRFTQEQCKKWGIPLKRLPVENSFDFDEMSWTGGMYALLPENIVRPGEPIVFVPWHLLRGDDELASEKAKQNVLRILRNDPELSERFSGLLSKKIKEIDIDDIRSVVQQENSLIDTYLKMVGKNRTAPYDFGDDPLNFLAFKRFKLFFTQNPDVSQDEGVNSCNDLLFQTKKFISIFEQEICVRNGWKECWSKDRNDRPKPANEVPTGRLFRGMGFAFFSRFDEVTFLPETGTGNGFMDFFIIFKSCRIVIELKNLCNSALTGTDQIPAYLHGIEKQIPDYVRSVGAPVKYAFYLTFQHYAKNHGKKSADHTSRVIEIQEKRKIVEKFLKDETSLEEFFYINFDVTPKASASKK